jgi:hypothetical protein
MRRRCSHSATDRIFAGPDIREPSLAIESWVLNRAAFDLKATETRFAPTCYCSAMSSARGAIFQILFVRNLARFGRRNETLTVALIDRQTKQRSKTFGFQYETDSAPSVMYRLHDPINSSNTFFSVIDADNA